LFIEYGSTVVVFVVDLVVVGVVADGGVYGVVTWVEGGDFGANLFCLMVVVGVEMGWSWWLDLSWGGGGCEGSVMGVVVAAATNPSWR
jgi:hypothetical protein